MNGLHNEFKKVSTFVRLEDMYNERHKERRGYFLSITRALPRSSRIKKTENPRTGVCVTPRPSIFYDDNDEA